MKEKAQKLKEFDNAWIVVTDSKLKKNYQEYGKVLGRFEVKKVLSNLFS